MGSERRDVLFVNLRKKIEDEYSNTQEQSESICQQFSRMDFVHNINIVNNSLIVTFIPITLYEPDSVNMLNLGRLRLKIAPNNEFMVFWDDTSERDKHIPLDRIHPHISQGGNSCLGTASLFPEYLNRDKDILMFVAMMYDFLKQYNDKDAFWHPFLYDPCRECPKDFDCRYCACHECSYHYTTEEDCEDCPDCGCVSGSKIYDSICNSVYSYQKSGVNNDNLIDLHKKIEVFMEE